MTHRSISFCAEGTWEKLRPGNIHIWWASLEEQTTCPRLLSPSFLSDDEKRRAGSFLFPVDRRRFCSSRAFLRTLLSCYAPVQPAEWEFCTNSYGRPEILFPMTTPRLRFNVSHTRTLVAIAIAQDFDVGIDIEEIREEFPLSVAHAYFSPEENFELDRLDSESRRLRFFQYWTLKEAYLKARGVGMTLPLDAFTFHMPATNRGNITITGTIEEQPQAWQFFSTRVVREHQLAVAIRMPAQDARFIIRKFT